jgi:hypothetical protein
MEFDSLSESAQADINNLFGKEPAPEPEAAPAAVEEEADLEVDEDIETDVEPDEETDEVIVDEDDSEEGETQTPEPDIEYIKASGKKVKVDFHDRDHIKRTYSMAAGAREWQAERDTLRVENADLRKVKETMDYLDGIKDDHEELFEAVTGTKLQDKFQEWSEEQNLVGGMTEAEKTMYLSNQDHQKRIREVERREKTLTEKLEGAERRDEEAKTTQQASIANPIFLKYNFDTEFADNQLELRMNRALWSEAKTELAGFDTVTPDMVEETFKRISNQIRAGFKSSADRSVKATVKTQRKAAKAAAQKKAVAPPKNDRKKELDEKLAANDIAGILQGGFDLSKYKG